MTVAEGAVFQQSVLRVNLVQLESDIHAANPGPDQIAAPAMHLAVDFPDFFLPIGGGVEEHGPLQRLVVARDHREAVDADNVALLQFARGHRVVRAVGIETGLHPGPGIHQRGVRVAPCDLAHHRPGRCQRDLVLGHALSDRLQRRSPADVGDRGAVADDLLLLV